MYELVERKCACGCGKTFKCFPNSPQKYFGREHEPFVKLTSEEYLRKRRDAKNKYFTRAIKIKNALKREAMGRKLNVNRDTLIEYVKELREKGMGPTEIVEHLKKKKINFTDGSEISPTTISYWSNVEKYTSNREATKRKKEKKQKEVEEKIEEEEIEEEDDELSIIISVLNSNLDPDKKKDIIRKILN